MALRKKISRHFTRSDPSTPSRHALPTSAPRALLPPFQFESPSTPPHASTSTSPPPRTSSKHYHRRSRSFSDLDTFIPAWITSGQEGGRGVSSGSDYSQRSVDQPWRSQDTWRALHAPPRSVSSPSAHPVCLGGTGGWRSHAGEGFFAARHTPRQRRRVLADDWAVEETSEEKKSTRSTSTLLARPSPAPSTTKAKVDASIDSGNVSTNAPPDEPGYNSSRLEGDATAETIPEEEAAPRGENVADEGKNITGAARDTFRPRQAIAGELDHRTSTHHRKESLLPPLLPSTVVRSSLRSSSFTFSRWPLSPGPMSPSWPSSPVTLDIRPIPWGRRSSIDPSAATPALRSPGMPPRPPRSLRRAPHKPLPSPPSEDGDLVAANSPTKPPSTLDSITTDEEGGDESVISHGERVVTPVTPPRPRFRPSQHSLKATDAVVRDYMSVMRKVSCVTLNSASSASRASRGGWI